MEHGVLCCGRDRGASPPVAVALFQYTMPALPATQLGTCPVTANPAGTEMKRGLPHVPGRATSGTPGLPGLVRGGTFFWDPGIL